MAMRSATKVAWVSRPVERDTASCACHFVQGRNASIGSVRAIDVCVQWVAQRAFKYPNGLRIKHGNLRPLSRPNLSYRPHRCGGGNKKGPPAVAGQGPVY